MDGVTDSLSSYSVCVSGFELLLTHTLETTENIGAWLMILFPMSPYSSAVLFLQSLIVLINCNENTIYTRKCCPKTAYSRVMYALWSSPDSQVLPTDCCQ